MLGRAVARGLQFGGGLSMPVKTHSFANGAYRPVTLIVAGSDLNRQSLILILVARIGHCPPGAAWLGEVAGGVLMLSAEDLVLFAWLHQSPSTSAMSRRRGVWSVAAWKSCWR